MADLALAVDIGGTKMAAGLVALDGTLLHRTMQPTPPSAGPDDAEALWDAVAVVVGGVTALVGKGDRLVVCGTGCGGPMSPGGDEVSPLNIPGWRSFPLRSRLTAAPTNQPARAKGTAQRRRAQRKHTGARLAETGKRQALRRSRRARI